VAFIPQLVCVLFLVAPRDVGFLVLPVPRFDQHDIVFSNPDALLHLARNPCCSFDAVHTPDADAVGPEHVLDDGEYLVVVGHAQVLSSFIAHTCNSHGHRYNSCRLGPSPRARAPLAGVRADCGAGAWRSPTASGRSKSV